MSRALITESKLTAIANAIRAKNGSSSEYTPDQMAAAIAAIPTGGITPSGTKRITQNGTHDVTQYASANVNVPNSYAAGDEGKVVSNGALLAQTSRSVTANGTYDTTTNDEVVVSVQPNLQSKTVTQNGTVTPDQGYDGLSNVVVNVSGGGGDIDLSYLPNSTAANVLASSPLLKTNINYMDSNRAYVDLSAANTDVTCYCVTKNRNGNENILLCVPYANSGGNSPSFYSPNGGYYVECTVYEGNTRVSGVTCDTDHVYALSVNAQTKKVRYFIDGVYLMEKSFNNSGNAVVVGAGDKNASSYNGGNPLVQYIGVVSGVEADATIIANQQTIMTKLGMSV